MHPAGCLGAAMGHLLICPLSWNASCDINSGDARFFFKNAAIARLLRGVILYDL
jgi:hypothetical protein